jgi:hypothetical protein
VVKRLSTFTAVVSKSYPYMEILSVQHPGLSICIRVMRSTKMPPAVTDSSFFAHSKLKKPSTNCRYSLGEIGGGGGKGRHAHGECMDADVDCDIL